MTVSERPSDVWRALDEALRRLDQSSLGSFAIDDMQECFYAAPPTVAPLYSALSRVSMVEVLARMGLDAGSVFADFGCGVGRWLLAARASGVREIRGVEYCPQRAAAAREAVSPDVHVVTGDGLGGATRAFWHAPLTHLVWQTQAARRPMGDAFWEQVARHPTLAVVAVWQTPTTLPVGYELAARVHTETPMGSPSVCRIYRHTARARSPERPQGACGPSHTATAKSPEGSS